MAAPAPGGMSTEHYLITRFNIEFPKYPGAGLNPEWLEQRLPLFLDFCLPSVAGQSRPDFSWIVMMDARTPDRYRERIASALRNASPGFTVLPALADWKGTLREHVRGRLAPGTTHVITSRLDNDDCIHRDFIALVQEELAPAEAAVLAFALGFTYSTATGQLRIRGTTANPFASMKERRAEELLTVHCDLYENLGRYAPVIRAAKPAAWLQIIHARNVHNRERGKAVENPREILRREFSIEVPPVALAVPRWPPGRTGAAASARISAAARAAPSKSSPATAGDFAGFGPAPSRPARAAPRSAMFSTIAMGTKAPSRRAWVSCSGRLPGWTGQTMISARPRIASTSELYPPSRITTSAAACQAARSRTSRWTRTRPSPPVSPSSSGCSFELGPATMSKAASACRRASATQARMSSSAALPLPAEHTTQRPPGAEIRPRRGPAPAAASGTGATYPTYRSFSASDRGSLYSAPTSQTRRSQATRMES